MNSRRFLSFLPLAEQLLKSHTQVSIKKWTPLAYYGYQKRSLTTKTLSPSLELATNYSKDIKMMDKFKVRLDDKRPLAVLMVWLMSHKKHVYKYAKCHMDMGFDVLVVRCTPWQLMWPVKGSHVVAGELLSFLHENEAYNKTVLHGFSVGCYLWGEVLYKMSQDRSKYQPTMDRIIAQIWDSPVDYGEIPIGVPKSVFPTNAFLRKCLETYVVFHMKTFQESATKHHLIATDQFFNSIVRTPAMFLFSLGDPMVNLKSVERCRGIWQKNGMEVNLRAWERPPHVGILQRHPEEYQDEIRKFIGKHVLPDANKTEEILVKEPIPLKTDIKVAVAGTA